MIRPFLVFRREIQRTMISITFPVIFTIGLCQAEIFTSMQAMQDLLGEKEIMGAIDNYIAAETDRLEKLRR